MDFSISGTTVIRGFESVIFMVLLCILTGFIVYTLTSKKRLNMLHKYYIMMCIAFIVWLSAMVAMWAVGLSGRTPVGDEIILWILDSSTYIGVTFIPVFELMIALNLTKKAESIPKVWGCVFILPIITNTIVWTNGLHHLMYVDFSVVRSNISFGNYMMVSGVLNYVILLAADIILISAAVKRKEKLFWQQSIMLCLGTLVPLGVSVIATFLGNLSIAATPLSFTVFLFCNYIAIYRLHVLDLVPLATKHVLDYISDGYLVLNDEMLVVDDNLPFRNGIGSMLGIEIGKFLQECRPSDVGQGITARRSLMGALEECRKSRSQLSYEQYFIVNDGQGGDSKKLSYIVDITPMIIRDKISGYAIVFKDITQLRKSLEQVQNSRERLMEQERLAMLGQMVGGLAHNLKTPIMSIAGCTSSIESLVQEISESIGDDEVTEEDYREIIGEIYEWISKMRTSCSYMSDIITAIKGQAQIASANDKAEFSIDDMIKRTQLLMRHELNNAGIELVVEKDYDVRLTLSGDINSLIQVLNNLISNAIYAEKEAEEKKIFLAAHQDKDRLRITVTDTGKGIDPNVADKLFKEMVTTKGTHGTGLGLYISSTTIKGKFGGEMWHMNAPVHGAVFGIDIPISENTQQDEVPTDEKTGGGTLNDEFC